MTDPAARLTRPGDTRVAAGAPTRTLCLGEALVDFVSERPGRELTAVDRFSPHLGGVAANVALVAARAGARIALAGGAGDDVWGHWLLGRLRDAGVDVSLFALLGEFETQLAFVTVGAEGEPAYHLRGQATGTIVPVLGERLDQAVHESAALFISSNTLVAGDERELTMRARELTIGLGRPVIFDANLRLHRWGSRDEAADAARACLPGALLARANRAEAELMTGEQDPERAANALVRAGAQSIVLTLGCHGAILRGAVHADEPGVDCRVLNTAGAGDVLTGTLLARLALGDFDPAAIAGALPEAVAAAARACERWGAVD